MEGFLQNTLICSGGLNNMGAGNSRFLIGWDYLSLHIYTYISHEIKIK
jgi:hypothetical protein